LCREIELESKMVAAAAVEGLEEVVEEVEGEDSKRTK
jgi:hypothetical protein